MDPRALLDYHERTKHSYESVRQHAGGLDWANEPSPFKEYVDLEPIGLPEPSPSGVPAHEAIVRSSHAVGGAALDLDVLSHVLAHAAGVTRNLRGSFGEVFFRTYASAGALYPNEIYVVAGDIEGLESGVYHYAPREHAVRRLRGGDHRGVLQLHGEPTRSATIVITGIPWRTAWKYESRGFRHLYWDAGMIIANLLAAAAAKETFAGLVLGFVDEAVNQVIAVDGTTEFALCLVTLGPGEDPPDAGEPEELSFRTSPVSAHPRRDPLIEGAHAASLLTNRDEVERFRRAPRPQAQTPSSSAQEVRPLSADQLSRDPLETVVRRRGSTRRLALQSIPGPELAALLDGALGTVPTDWDSGIVRTCIVASGVEGVPPSAYRYERGGRFITVREGDLRRKAGFVCLEQRLGAEAAAAVFFMSGVEQAVDTLGPRGYAAAQLEAAIAAGRLYLGAYAQCLGASGITFYDDEVRLLFDTSEEPMLAVVMGPEGQRRSIIECRGRMG